MSRTTRNNKRGTADRDGRRRASDHKCRCEYCASGRTHFKQATASHLDAVEAGVENGRRNKRDQARREG